jgi:hypothetical protein
MFDYSFLLNRRNELYRTISPAEHFLRGLSWPDLDLQQESQPKVNDQLQKKLYSRRTFSNPRNCQNNLPNSFFKGKKQTFFCVKICQYLN